MSSSYQHPAVVVGGPPHSGKSVFVYHLTHTLRAADIAHYVLRACPDGEGDWYLHHNHDDIKHFRYKGGFTSAFVEFVVHLIEHRHIPLIIDIGGKPTLEQEAIPAACTHAILLISDQAEDDVVENWLNLVERCDLQIVADLRTTLAPHLTTLCLNPLCCLEHCRFGAGTGKAKRYRYCGASCSRVIQTHQSIPK